MLPPKSSDYNCPDLMKVKLYGLLFALLFITKPAIAEVTDINVAQLQALLAENATVIDVRRNDEWSSTGVIDGSIPLTFFDQYGAFDAVSWMDQISTLVEKEAALVLICHAGVRSRWVADWLDSNSGFSRIYNVTEGMAGWISQGYPVVDHQ
jgi:rhodanese-related sulfurtransferase